VLAPADVSDKLSRYELIPPRANDCPLSTPPSCDRTNKYAAKPTSLLLLFEGGRAREKKLRGSQQSTNTKLDDQYNRNKEAANKYLKVAIHNNGLNTM
jgi:hypothetical protein